VESILIVDETEAEQTRLSELLSVGDKYRIHTSASGDEAFDLVTKECIDLVITDLRAPQSDGLERLQDEFPRIPVIVIARQGSEELTVKAIQQGAAGYLKKGSPAHRLHSMVEKLLAGRATDLAHAALLRRRELDEYEFKLPSRRVLMSATAGFLRQRIQASEICPDKELLRLGIALEESLLNACLHGNLELDSALREHDGDLFESLADERSALSPWKDRHVYVNASVTQERALIKVRDEGVGFDPASLPDPTDPENLLKPHGRGVMIMKLFMDEVIWNASGNEVTMVKNAVEAIE
jgi:DNA-binding NarL/FixJ family response regulator